MSPWSWSHPRGRPETVPYTGKMATTMLRLPLRLSMKNMSILGHKPSLKTSNISRWTQNRTAVSTPSGAILPKPDKVSFIFSRFPIEKLYYNMVGGVKLN